MSAFNVSLGAEGSHAGGRELLEGECPPPCHAAAHSCDRGPGSDGAGARGVSRDGRTAGAGGKRRGGAHGDGGAWAAAPLRGEPRCDAAGRGRSAWAPTPLHARHVRLRDARAPRGGGGGRGAGRRRDGARAGDGACGGRGGRAGGAGGADGPVGGGGGGGGAWCCGGGGTGDTVGTVGRTGGDGGGDSAGRCGGRGAGDTAGTVGGGGGGGGGGGAGAGCCGGRGTGQDCGSGRPWDGR